MFKVGSCNLCQRVFRTGGLRQLIQRDISAQSEEKAKSGRKVMFSESRIVVCTECYKRLEKGEGVDVYDVVEDILDGNKLGSMLGENVANLSKSIGGKGRQSVLDKVTADLATKSKGKSDTKLKKERKPRGVRVSTKGSTIAKSLASSTFEDEDIDEKSKEKRGRKPKVQGKTIDNLAESSVAKVEAITEKVISDFDKKFPHSEVKGDDVVIPTSMPSLKETETVEEKIVTNQDRKLYKEQVRQALTSNGNIMYSEIARKLNIDEGLVSQLANEIDGES
jgi:hypothetical protein